MCPQQVPAAPRPPLCMLPDRRQLVPGAVCSSLVLGSQYSPLPPAYRQPFPYLYPPSYSHAPAPRPFLPAPPMPHTHYPAPGLGVTYSAPYSSQPHLYSHVPSRPVSPPVYPTPYYPRAQLYRSPQRSVRPPPGFTPEPRENAPTPASPPPAADPSPGRPWLPRNRVSYDNVNKNQFSLKRFESLRTGDALGDAAVSPENGMCVRSADWTVWI
ncbi:unnamed protein product [Danaus chrysippus]|uniref:(African queen) hypothetical protein n=1 Tax=Danaus chrysippus TaxID=151541 RepID=A0A8J2QKN1_9NEOP|nr:unnamed protein product [Danaus chrysippus]